MRKPDPHSDEALMMALQNGDRKALNGLYRRYKDPLFRFFYRQLRQDADLAADMLQELFLKVFEQANRFSPEKPFRPWIWSIAANLCKNQYRKWENGENAFATWQHLQSTGKKEQQAPGKIHADHFQQELNKELDQLDPDRKMIFTLRYQQEMTVPEIAQIMNLPEGTVKSRIFYTLKILQKKLAAFKPENV